MAGAVSGNSGGVIFIGKGNKEARCLLRRPKRKRPECVLGEDLEEGLGVISNEIWPPELPSERDDSEARGGTGRDSEDVISS